MNDITKNINEMRKQKLGLESQDTNKLFETIMNVYESKIIEEPREIMDYVIDITISNMNGFNKLGAIENIYDQWGDYFYIDLNNSAFAIESINKNGDIEINQTIEFSEIPQFSEIKDISFSLSDMIKLCKEHDLYVKLFSDSTQDSDSTSIEIIPYKKFDNENSIVIYLSSLDK